jgi:hypothetical protein
MSNISEKVQKLRQAAFDPDAALDAMEQSNVGGGIFARYVKMSGPAANPATNRRDLGIPRSWTGRLSVPLRATR